MQRRAYTRKHRGCQQNGRLRGKPRRKFPIFEKILESISQEVQRTPSRKIQRNPC